MKRFVFALIITLISLLITLVGTVHAQAENPWPMVAHDPQRTSYTPEQLGTNFSIAWYHPIEPYIPYNFQVIAAESKIFMATSRGLYALDSSTGSLLWTYPTELPLGNSPTYSNGILYVGGFDKKLYAINASNGLLKSGWAFNLADAGFETNPLVANGKVYLGNRDGYFYAFDASTGALSWKFKTDGPIRFAAAQSKKDGTVIYFASDDMYGYALKDNGATATELWATKLGGAGFGSYWPVVYTYNNSEYVIFSGSSNYRDVDGNDEFGHWSTTPMQEEWAEIFAINGSFPHTDATTIEKYYNNKLYRHFVFVLEGTTGQEYAPTVNFTGGGSGKAYAPFTLAGMTHSGNKYPPIIGSDNKLYDFTVLQSGGIAQGQIVSWQFGTTSIQPINSGVESVDEPFAFSFGGNTIYYSRCCDRTAGYTTIGGSSGSIISRDLNQQTNNQYEPRYFSHEVEGWGVYGSVNGVYGRHGVQAPMVPYKGLLYMQKGNDVLAFRSTVSGNTTGLPEAPIVTVTPAKPNISDSTLKQKLETEVQKMVDSYNSTGKFLDPGHYSSGFFDNKSASSYPGCDGSEPQRCTGLEAGIDYFHNPSDTIATLVRALPYLSPSLATQTRAYLQSFYARYPLASTAHIGWNGVMRTAYDIPNDLQSAYANFGSSGTVDGAPWSYSPDSFYGAWKYAATFMTQSQALTLFNSMKSKFPALPSASITDYRWFYLNQYLNGLRGYMELEKLAGVTSAITQSSKYNQYIDPVHHTGLIDTRIQNFTTNTPSNTQNTDTTYLDHIWYIRALNVSMNFMFLEPEVVKDLLTYDTSGKMLAALNEYRRVAPYWFVSKFDMSIGENAMQQLWDYGSLFQATALIDPSATKEVLFKYLDKPAFPLGDLFYVNNIISTIEAPASGPCTASCTGKSCGDDGCGGSCGTCTGGQVCSPVYACVAPSPTPIPSLTPTPSPTPIGGAPVMLINAGASVDTVINGQTWKADNYYSGGATMSYPDTITGTTIPQIYQTERFWDNTPRSYSIPLSNGPYVVKLHFAENYTGITGAGQRVFSVNVEGTPLNDLDVFAEAGGRNKALVKTFAVTVTDNNLTITFTPQTQNPFIDGIEVENPAAAPLQGDFNSDGVVDWQDWLSFIPNFDKALNQFQLVTGSLVSIFDLNKLIGNMFK